MPERITTAKKTLEVHDIAVEKYPRLSKIGVFGVRGIYKSRKKPVKKVRKKHKKKTLGKWFKR